MTDALPTLKVVLAWSDRRNLCSIIGDGLRSLAPGDEVRPLGEDAHVVHTALTTSDLRDRLQSLVQADEGLFVAEFETWSAHGAAVDSRWLLARGH